ncbi:HpcH/HpaI aldolase/citrate lyase family protein [Agromyces atrinae]|uniref:Citrate lyase subunit beta/citryl-CoA lyase n=1 Tax=Agromyces atrinae TaxID=592376 RepID=A0A852SII9_9MICO|nr:aldolase/citrate lyase family protein [Agromyces atrinae]NYD68255.1 citrate lyase subunit beta/citryl-CoA lyase [Agromyces atrinae]
MAAELRGAGAVIGARTVPPGIARTWLLVPGSAAALETRIAASQADVVVVDLEDGVAAADRPAARDALAGLADRTVRPWARISDATTTDWAADVALARTGVIAGLVLAKVESAEHVRATVDAVGGAVPVVALVESARGIEAALEIAEAAGTVRLAFGSGDFRRDTGAADDPMALLYARSRLVSTSRAAGLPGPIDGPTVGHEASVLVDASRHAASLGMTGRLCLREEQVAAVAEALSPSPTEIAWALDVLETTARFGIRDGSDLPRLARARAIRSAAASFGLEAGDAPDSAYAS